MNDSNNNYEEVIATVEQILEAKKDEFEASLEAAILQEAVSCVFESTDGTRSVEYYVNKAIAKFNN